MIRIFGMFVLVFSCFYVGIPAFRKLSGREKWEVTKIALYSLMCAILTLVVMALFVYAF